MTGPNEEDEMPEDPWEGNYDDSEHDEEPHRVFDDEDSELDLAEPVDEEVFEDTEGEVDLEQ